MRKKWYWREIRLKRYAEGSIIKEEFKKLDKKVWRDVLVSKIGKDVLLAVVENEKLVELHTIKTRTNGYLGNIYKGRIKRIIQGMDAAFVDLGEEKDGFLYITDLQSNWEYWLAQDETFSTRQMHRRSHHILDLTQEGHEILVQIKREPIDHKAPRVSTKISLVGTYLVYTPTASTIGVSRHIIDPERRAHLKRLGRKWVGKVGGLIFRTASVDVDDDVLEQEWEELSTRWKFIVEKAKSSSAPRLLYAEPSPVLCLIRDLCGPLLRKVYIDNGQLFHEIQSYLESHHPEWLPLLTYYDKQQPLLSRFDVHREIQKILRPKVWLKSGAYLIINQTDALVTIDVNSGKNFGENNFQESVLRVNLEAVKEIVRQIRLRNLSGLILIDFIDMEPPENWYTLRECFEEELKKDRARTYILPQSGKSLVLLTRQKSQDSLPRMLTRKCPRCRGAGFTRHPRMIGWDIIWKLSQIQRGLFHQVVIRAHPDVIRYLHRDYGEKLRDISKKLQSEIVLREDTRIHFEQYDMTFS